MKRAHSNDNPNKNNTHDNKDKKEISNLISKIDNIISTNIDTPEEMHFLYVKIASKNKGLKKKFDKLDIKDCILINQKDKKQNEKDKITKANIEKDLNNNKKPTVKIFKKIIDFD